MANEYGMSYSLRCAPPKPREALGSDEGLADRLLVISVVGLPGTGPGSYLPVQLGPEGHEDPDPSIWLHAAVILLHALDTNLHGRLRSDVGAVVTDALGRLRAAMILPAGQDSG